MRRVVLRLAAVLSLFPVGGCMAWRSVCREPREIVGKEARTARKYEIVEVKYRLGNAVPPDDGVGSKADALFGSAEAWDRIMQYRPGVFEARGVPVKIAVTKWERKVGGGWTWFFPFALTATIVPAYIHEEFRGELEVSVAGMRPRCVVFGGVDDWSLSCLSPIGAAPYVKPPNPTACIWERNTGSVSPEPLRKGIAEGLAVVLMLMESEQSAH